MTPLPGSLAQFGPIISQMEDPIHQDNPMDVDPPPPWEEDEEMPVNQLLSFEVTLPGRYESLSMGMFVTNLELQISDDRYASQPLLEAALSVYSMLPGAIHG